MFPSALIEQGFLEEKLVLERRLTTVDVQQKHLAKEGNVFYGKAFLSLGENLIYPHGGLLGILYRLLLRSAVDAVTADVARGLGRAESTKMDHEPLLQTLHSTSCKWNFWLKKELKLCREDRV